MATSPQSQSVLQFVIVGQDDVPLFDADLTQMRQADQQYERPQYLYHFVLHAALDAVDDQEWSANSMYLGVVDRFNNLQVSAYTSGSRIRMLMLHDGRSEESVKAFMKGVHDLLVPIMLNPFFLPKERITSVDFHSRVRKLARAVFK
eukprot:jgi/Picsp_1/1150/NSC_04631-R1_trafficking protein particle complex protein 2